MIRKTLIFTFSLVTILATSLTSHAQNKINLGVQTGTFYSDYPGNNKIFQGFLMNTSGVFAGYKWKRHWQVEAGYSKWFDLFHAGLFAPDVSTWVNPFIAEWQPGTIVSSMNYSMLNVKFGYHTSIHNNNFFVSAGPAIAWGKDFVITSVSPDIIGIPSSKMVNNHHGGFICEAGYNYSLFHDHASVGIAISAQKYNIFTQYSANLQFAYQIPVRNRAKSHDK